ncbi:hypothetical protein RJ639_018179 [Escallonia herrerae]|uniref:GTP cyclohydrolase 1 n=1 Tax=Escallonia herrerae TaxID=1293975 RepID=A0AA88V994_9ASTE|nr:hypothetical protein RJ639_018179 [Escallonia herrerae]
MGALDEGCYNVKLENGVKLGSEIEREEQTLAIEDAVKVLLQGLGEDINREGLRKTPHRVAKALQEGTRGYKQKVKDIVQGALFPEAGLESGVGHAGGEGGPVMVRDLDLFSYCESCLLPFQVKCHVGYVPSGQRVVGLSKLYRVADVFAKRLQAPQRLADEVCSALQHGIKPKGVVVILQCSHIHFPNIESALHGSDQQRSVQVLVTSGSGIFDSGKPDEWGDFLGLLRNIDMKHRNGLSDQCWCPSHSSTKVGPTNSGMVAAVASIIDSLGEDPLRNELLGTPARFVKWLTNFKSSNVEMKLNGFVHSMDPVKCNGSVSHSEHRIYTELNLPFWSQCEHHLLPFHGVVHIGYYSTKGFDPLEKTLLQSVVHFHGFKLQVQERLTRQIAETVSLLLGRDIMVVVEAIHTCMMSRGIEKCGSNTATIAVLGHFLTDPVARANFLQKIPDSSTVG